MPGELNWVTGMIEWAERHWGMLATATLFLSGQYAINVKRAKRLDTIDRRLGHIEEHHCPELRIDEKIDECHGLVLVALHDGMDENTEKIMNCIRESKIDRIQEEIDKLEWKRDKESLNDMESWELKKLQSKLHKLEGK